MITYRYINKNKQPTSIAYALIIEDEYKEKFAEPIRIQKVFKIEGQRIDEEFLRLEAYKEINRILKELENPTEIPPDVPLIEEVPVGDPIE